MFQTPPSAGPALPSLPSNAGGPGEFTRMMSTPSAPAENLFQPPAIGEADLFGPQPGAASHSDEFSRVASASRPAPPAAAAKPASSAAAAKPKSGVLPIVLILGALAIVAIVLIIVFAR
jgi:hypothetical protein